MNAPGAANAGRRSSGPSGSHKPRGFTMPVPGSVPGGAPGAPMAPGAHSAGQKRARPDGGGRASMGLPNAGGQTHRKRATVAPARLSAGGDGAVKAELKEAKKVLKDLMGRQVAWPFNKPVDVTKIPQYYEVISHPMDLGTIRKKLEGGEYEDLVAFTSDLRLVWQNCYTFNRDDPPNDPNSVTSMARELEQRSEALLAQIPHVLEQERAEKLEKETDIQKDLKKQLREMQKAQLLQQELMMKQMQQMQQQMMMGGMAPPMMPGMTPMMGMASMMMPGMAPMMPGMMQQAAPRGGGRGGRKSGSGRGGGGGFRGGKALGGGMVPYGGGGMDAYGGAMVPAPPMDRGDMSFDQRAQISAGIARLGPNDLSKAVKIIQDNNPSLASGDGHIEVDINALDNPTLWRLWDYLEKCNGPKSKKGSGGGKRGSAANSLLSNIDAASMRNPHQLQQVRNARSSLASAADGGASGGGVFSGADDGADDGWMSEGDSDGGKAPTGGGGGGAGGGMWQSFQQTKESHLRQQQQAQQQQARQQEAAAAETERARRAAQDQRQLAQRQRDEQRQREREERERQRQGAGIDMMGQQKAMTEADQWGGDGFDEYGLGGF